MIAQVAQTYSISPLQAAHELDNDPEQLALVCIPLLEYGRAKAAFDAAGGDPDKLKAWEGSRIMERVQENTMETLRRRRQKREG